MVETLGHDEPVPDDAAPMGAPERLRFRLSLDAERFAEVLGTLARPSELPRLHPLIHRVTETSNRIEGTVRTTEFSIDESIPLLGGLISFPNTYRGRIAVDSARPTVVRTSGWSSPRVRVELRYVVLPGGVLEETLWFSAPWVVRSLVRKTLLASHTKTLLAARALALGA